MLKDLAYRLLSDRMRGGKRFGPAGTFDKKAAKFARKQAKADAYRRGWADAGFGGGYKGYKGDNRHGLGSGNGYIRHPSGLQGLLADLVMRFLGRRR